MLISGANLKYLKYSQCHMWMWKLELLEDTSDQAGLNNRKQYYKQSNYCNNI